MARHINPCAIRNARGRPRARGSRPSRSVRPGRAVCPVRRARASVVDDAPGSVRLAAGRALGGFAAAVDIDGLRVLAAIVALRRLVRRSGRHLARMARIRVAPAHRLVGAAVLQRVVGRALGKQPVLLVEVPADLLAEIGARDGAERGRRDPARSPGRPARRRQRPAERPPFPSDPRWSRIPPPPVRGRRRRSQRSSSSVSILSCTRPTSRTRRSGPPHSHVSRAPGARESRDRPDTGNDTTLAATGSVA